MMWIHERVAGLLTRQDSSSGRLLDSSCREGWLSSEQTVGAQGDWLLCSGL